MSGLKQELGLGQGVGLLSTSLLGTGVFAVRRWRRWSLAITACGHGRCSFSLFSRLPSSSPCSAAIFPARAAWPTLSIWPLGHVWPASPAAVFLSVIPVGLPAALHIATGFGGRCSAGMMRSCCWRSWAPRHRLVGRFAWRQLQRQPADVGCRTDCGADRRSLVARRDKPGADPLPGPGGD